VVAAAVVGALILGGFLSCGAFIVVKRWQNRRAATAGLAGGWSKTDKAARYYNADTWRDDL
jgi:hypothetical protein